MFFTQLRLLNQPTIQSIPKKCRVPFVEEYNKLLLRVLENIQDLEAHARFQAFPKCVLCPAPQVARTARHQERVSRRDVQFKYTSDCLRTWSSGDLVIESFLLQLLFSTRQSFSRSNISNNNIGRCKEFASLGRFSDATKTLMSSGVAAASPIVMQSLKDLHPVVADMPYQLSEIGSPSIVVTVTQVEESIRSFPKGSAGGRDGLRPQHLMDILQCPVSRSRDLYLKRLTVYVNISLAGKLPASIATFITSAPVYPLIKNGSGVRPIAVGEVLRRLTSKLASSAVRHTAVEHLSPLQVGVGIKMALKQLSTQ